METINKIKSPLVLALLVGAAVLANLVWIEKKYELEEPEPPQSSQVEYVNLAGAVVKVEVVSTPEKLRLGLSGREGLPKGEGMLFVFPSAGEYPFWMKEMKFAIDIIWIGEDGRVAFIKDSATPESFPEVFKPERKARYVLEVLAGFAKKNNLKVGDGVEFVF